MARGTDSSQDRRRVSLDLRGVKLTPEAAAEARVLQSTARLFGVGSQDVVRQLLSAKKQAQGQQAIGHTVDPDEAVSHRMLEIRESLGSGLEHMMEETPLGVPRAPVTREADAGAVERSQGEPTALTGRITGEKQPGVGAISSIEDEKGLVRGPMSWFSDVDMDTEGPRGEYEQREAARAAGTKRPKRVIGGLSHTPGMD
jgi:hypothetical protein